LDRQSSGTASRAAIVVNFTVSSQARRTRCGLTVPYIVDVARGYEYEPLRRRYTIAPGHS
jgi:hypothetical protein